VHCEPCATGHRAYETGCRVAQLGRSSLAWRAVPHRNLDLLTTWNHQALSTLAVEATCGQGGPVDTDFGRRRSSV
jgi:hypothetical protein